MTPQLRYPWLVTDLDGTLVDRDLEIPARNLEAVDRYRAAGGTVTIATGRNERSAGRYHAQLGLDTPLILYNGARIVDLASGRRLLDLTLGEAWPLVAARALPRLPSAVGAVGFHDLDAYVLKPAPALTQYAGRDQIQLVETAPPGSPTKLMLIAESPGELDQVAELIASVTIAVRLVRSEKTYLEILPANADKGSALRALVASAGVSLDQVAAVGDNPNDLELIQTAGLGAAVADGHAEVVRTADVVVAACSDAAVADLIDRYLLC
ncbi:Cof-like hydrolase [Kribbella flavida DSM 17836]|uniref:Cof-like hydrolase n=1 Tax=Kribbella flavida (strain DSM 17836 / JCM 10339 / NBRC 14399) TaxID=479435 RepID=D2PPY4_KRIFD|nr:Cof-type HAD-IIB family hydrolase [Kribbella flavida]ADB32908.1 Cof-like hydrolase [Kribbella flavida DSM 17836]